jgi:hypothetical protein
LTLRRRPPVDVQANGVLLDELHELLDEMHVFDVMLTYGHLAGRRVSKRVLRPWVSSSIFADP